MVAVAPAHLTLWNVGPQQLQVRFDGGQVVTDTGLLAVRALERPLRVVADLAQRLPDPRAPGYIRHSAEALLTQQVYQILAGYPDCNDAQSLRHDPLFHILADQSPDTEHPLASASTLARFQYAFTRRQPGDDDTAVLRQRRSGEWHFPKPQPLCVTPPWLAPWAW